MIASLSLLRPHDKKQQNKSLFNPGKDADAAGLGTTFGLAAALAQRHCN
jgi:hypothetical protein